jgi:hypothetical protein
MRLAVAPQNHLFDTIPCEWVPTLITPTPLERGVNSPPWQAVAINLPLCYYFDPNSLKEVRIGSERKAENVKPS